MSYSIRFLFAAAMLASGVANAATTAPAQALLEPTVEQMSQLEGVYGLADGKRVRITQTDGRLYADLGKHLRLQLFLARPDTIASRDGRVSIRLAQPGKAEPLLVVRQADAPHLLLTSL